MKLARSTQRINPGSSPISSFPKGWSGISQAKSIRPLDWTAFEGL
jgi:hypothetical protein